MRHSQKMPQSSMTQEMIAGMLAKSGKTLMSRLNASDRHRLRSVMLEPGPDHWRDAKHIVFDAKDGNKITLFEAVDALDSDAANSWPDSTTIGWAIHGEISSSH